MDAGTPPTQATFTRGPRFWAIFLSTLLVEVLSALDLTAVATALPMIVGRLHGGADFIWAGGAYTIAATAIQPLVGGLATMFGRKAIMLAFVASFAAGSAVAGGAWTMRMLIAGRALQGLGSGGSLAMSDIIFADMVPLAERGKYQGIGAAMWALACAVGPPIGGALADTGKWRWLFWLNLPLCAISASLLAVCMEFKAPQISLKEKVERIDWTGNAIVIASTVLVMLALTWGGVRFPWKSAQVLVPLILGALGLVAFFVLQRYWLKAQTVPEFLFTSRTTLSGYLGTFFHGIVSLAVIFYYPVYLQAVTTGIPGFEGR